MNGVADRRGTTLACRDSLGTLVAETDIIERSFAGPAPDLAS